jgi:hypothetical protein
MQNEIKNLFFNINVRTVNDKPVLYKPVLVLYALGQCYLKNDRLISFKVIDLELSDIFKNFFPNEPYNNFYYSFGRLEKDGIWEVVNSKNLKRSSSGDLIKSELINNDVKGGFSENIYNYLIFNDYLITEICDFILNKYIDKMVHAELLKRIKITNHRNGNYMALINNEGEPVSRWWISKAIEIIKVDREIFASHNMRRARLELIAGKNRLTTIKGWMLAAQIIKNGKNSKEYELTNFGLEIKKHDNALEKSSTWWAFHLYTCFSHHSEPYSSFFLNLDNLSKDWINSKQLLEKIQNELKQENGEPYKESTLESLISSIRRMFVEDRPLEYLGLIETRKNQDGIFVRLGSPKLTDEIIIHALAMSRFHRYKSRESVDFSVLLNDGLAHFLCCSQDQLRQQLRRMKQSNRWQDYFNFNEAVDIDSISFAEYCTPDKTLLLLLQQGQDTWL